MPKTQPNKKYIKKNSNNNNPIEVSKVINTGSSSKLKKKIRDIERLLKKSSEPNSKSKLPANKKIEYERALKGLNIELQQSQFNIKQKTNATKYHMVRFFEKKKAIRKLKQLRSQFKEIEKTGIKKDIKKVRKQLRHGEIDLLYIVLFPKSEKYISLYPSSNNENLNDPNVKAGLKKTEARRSEFKKQVESMLKENKLDFTIDDILQNKKQIKTLEIIKPTKEIDAPETKEENKEEEEDDFFE
ncbi:EFG1 [Candida jiufengensis]|uniref:EFG1 n=1 Tax=Candida jiufengensis TaxID=497108 RepID=UPI00222584EA|nr:EFG1 [Candida jiufengensis]KAI5956341.1 EFG1 [Candida jiufengensis]